MIPVAGRRKGKAPPPPVAHSIGEPDWLFEDNNNSAPAPSGSVTNTAASPVPAAHDALSFLDFDDEPLPPAAPAMSIATSAAAAAPPPIVAPVHVASSSVSRVNHYESLQKELQATETELLPLETRIKLLERGDDELCQEVKRLEMEVCGKKEEVERAAVVQLELEESLELRRKCLQGKAGDFHSQDLIAITNTIEKQYESDLQSLKTIVEEQTASLLAARKKHSEMDDDIGATESYERVLAQLQEKIKKSVHEMNNGMRVCIKPYLIGSIRETVQQSAQQRLDILSDDRRRRSDEWQLFQQKMKEKFHSFKEERRLRHRVEFDSILAQTASKFRAALDNRLTASTQSFAERQRVITAETQQGIQHAIEEMVQRCRENLNTIEEKKNEELKRTSIQYAAELAHHARLHTAEREAAVRSQRRQAEEGQMDMAISTVYESFEKKLSFLESQVEQLRHSVVFDIEDVTRLNSRLGGETFPLGEKALMLKECERNARQLTERIGNQWQQFKAAVAPLEQCVNSMAAGLQEGRVRVAAMQQGTESVYRAWSHDVRRELSRCLTSSGVSSTAEELQSGVECMTQVVEELLAHLHPLRVIHAEGRAQQRFFRTNMEQAIGSLGTQQGNSNKALDAVFNVYDRLSRVDAELQAKRNTLEVAESEYATAKQQIERERAAFDVKLKEAEQLGAELRQTATILGKISVPTESMVHSPRVLQELTLENAYRDTTPRTKSKGLHQLKHQRRPQQRHPEVWDDTLIQSPGRFAGDEDTTAQFGKDESLADFVSLLTVDDSSSPTGVPTAPDVYVHRRQSHGSGYAPSSERVLITGSAKSFTTPSTSNS